MTDIELADKDLLTPRQRLFVNEYLVDLNGTQAAIRAGYGEEGAAVRAHENLKIPAIAEAVKAAMVDRITRLGVTQDWVIARLVENVDRAMTAVPVTDREGNPIGDYTYQGAVANKALEILGKHVGVGAAEPEPEGATDHIAEAIDRFTSAVVGLARQAQPTGDLPQPPGGAAAIAPPDAH